MAASDTCKSPGHVTSAPGNMHSANPAGLSTCTGRGSLQYQGINYNIVDESIPEQAFYLTQGDPLLELVSFSEPLQGNSARAEGLAHECGHEGALVESSVGRCCPGN